MPPRPDACVWNREKGFMLCEVLIAAAVGLILFGAAFACFRQAMYSMKRAEAIRAATTVGKDVMERSRAGLSSQHDSMLQKKYGLTVAAETERTGPFRKRIVTVRDEYGEVYRFALLERTK